MNKLLSVTSKSQCNLTHHLIDFLFELAYSAFTGIVFNDIFNGSFGELNLFLLQTIIVQFLRNQMATGYFYFFLCDISAYLNQFHSVEQGRRDGSQIIGGSNEHDFGQIIIHIQIVVMECIVLFRVQNFQHSRRRIATMIATQLVDFIQYNNRIGRFSLHQALDNSSWHSTDVCLTMTTDFGFIMDTSQRHSHIFTLKSCSNRSTKRSLTHTRRAIQTNDRRLHVVFQFQYSQMFQDAFLYLFQTIVVLVQGLFCILNAEIIGCIYVPRQGKQGLQISELHIIVWRLRINTLQLGNFFCKKFVHFLAPEFRRSLHAEFFNLTILATSQFILDVLDLLLQEIFLLLTINILASSHLNGLLDSSQTNFTIQNLNKLINAFFQIVMLQQLNLFIGSKREIGTNVIDQYNSIIQILDRKSHIRSHTVGHLNILTSQLLAGIHQRLEFISIFILHIFRHRRYKAFHVRLGFSNTFQLYFHATGLHNGSCISTRQFKNAQNTGNHTHMIDILIAWIFRFT